MNGYQRIMAALHGRQPDAVPIMLHNFMPAAREAGYSMRAYRTSAAAIAKTFIQAVETYEYDGIVVDVDTATLAEAVGVPVDFPEDEPARCRTGCLRDPREVSELPPPNIASHPRVQIWMEAVRNLRVYFGDEILVRGNADQAPFSLASMMRTPASWMMDLLDERNRTWVSRLLEYCTEATCQFVRLMAEAGAHVTSNGDSPAGPAMISPEMYRTFALPYEQRVAAAAHDRGLPYILHVCGDTEPILADLLRSGADGLELDYKTDARVARRTLAERATFIGNIDPSGVLARGSVAEVERTTRELLRLFADTPRFILNAGCALPATTPSENVQAMIQAAR
ncbi:MAG: uroporphyrinogen decarboxylase family protein [Planctomycetota bacterium]